MKSHNYYIYLASCLWFISQQCQYCRMYSIDRWDWRMKKVQETKKKWGEFYIYWR